MVDAFFQAARGGDFDALVRLLDPAAVLRTDGDRLESIEEKPFRTDLVIAVPSRDAHRITHDLASLLARPAEVVVVEGEWPV